MRLWAKSRRVRTVDGMSNYGLEVLDTAQCTSLLHLQRVGRIGLGGETPLVLPVVYALLEGDIVFRTAPGEKLIAAVMHRPVAFEIDDYDLENHTGWSVIVVGTASEIVHPKELERANALGLVPWAGEVRDRFVRITPTTISGRRIHPEPTD